MFTIALTGQKGGVGKSTTSICVASEWATRGRSVLVVDADPQQTASTWAAVAGEAGRQPPAVIAMQQPTMHRDGQLARVAASFERIVIDCPPRSDAIQRSALMTADVAVLPCGPSAADAWALAASIELVREAMALRPALRAFVLLTRVQRGTAIGRGAREVVEQAGLPILRSVLTYRVAYAEALAAGQGVAAYAPADVARLEIERLVDELDELAHTTHAPLSAAAGA
jgi:chromosome partitioning protein